MAGFTLAHLEAIESAIGTGTLSVYYGNKRVEYRNMKDLTMARDVILASLREQGLLASSARGGHTLATHSRD